jgi:hypothetical protein
MEMSVSFHASADLTRNALDWKFDDSQSLSYGGGEDKKSGGGWEIFSSPPRPERLW